MVCRQYNLLSESMEIFYLPFDTSVKTTITHIFDTSFNASFERLRKLSDLSKLFRGQISIFNL